MRTGFQNEIPGSKIDIFNLFKIKNPSENLQKFNFSLTGAGGKPSTWFPPG